MPKQFIHLGSGLDPATLESLADFVCGDGDRFPTYRSSGMLTRFFASVQLNQQHDGTTRKWWVLNLLNTLNPGELERVILRLVDLREYGGDKARFAQAVERMNDILAMDGMGVDFDGANPKLVRAAPLTITKEDLAAHRKVPSDTDVFLGKQFSQVIKVDDLKLDPVITPLLQARIDEAQACPRDKAPLATIFLLGSTLEGTLLGVALKDPALFMRANAVPKDRSGKAYPLHEWKLASLIDVAHEINLLSLDVKKFSHVLRDFRNFIHPYHQMSSNFSPDQQTVDICWQVFRAAFVQLKSTTP